VYWSPTTAATPDSAFAGVLAGLLIAAVAALLVQWYTEGAPPTIALFGSGVPILALSTYLFTVIGALHYPSPVDPKQAQNPPGAIDYTTPGGKGDNLCNQLWSEWLLATGSLFIGSAVLVCGLGWALVSYADNLAVNLCKTNIRNVPIKRIEDGRKFFIRLNAWLSVAVTTAATALLMVTTVIYLAAVDPQGRLKHEKFGETWYVLFFVYLFGLYFIGRASYAVISRTRSAGYANKKSCAAYAAGDLPVATDNEGVKAGAGTARPPAPKDPRFARRKELAIRAAQEFAGVILVALSAHLARYMTSGEAFNQPRKGIAVGPGIVIYVVVVYIIVRAVYVLVMGVVELVSAKKDGTATNNEAIPPANAKSVERIRIRYDSGRLRTTTYSVVILAILGTFFVAVLTQGPLTPGPRIVISLALGGFCPAVVLAGLSSSVPAAEDARKPKWEKLGWLMFLP
jgi:hypothetical protein